MAKLAMHPAPGNINPLLPNWVAVRERGVGDIVDTRGFSVPDRAMRAPVMDVTPGIGDILATRGFKVPQNPVMAYTSGQPAALGCVSCGGTCGQLNGVGVGDLNSDMSAIQSDFSAGNYGHILSDTIMGVPVWGVLAAVIVLPMVMGGKKGRR